MELFSNDQEIFILDKVYKEMLQGKDELRDWAKCNKSKVVDSALAVKEYQDVLIYLVSSNKWEPAGYELWASDINKADPWLIACAKMKSLIIVTDEKNSGPNGKKSRQEPKIPFVADRLGVRTIGFWEFLKLKKFVAR
ncbi:DUF4411 family protein [Liquorilactobacillus vini]|uniref:DUF4411 family protein n=1 Tax=Liquorilactobacillus vini TaxID=238015 RepID=UPI00054FF70E|nr:DUF4411 family protein [Liquorilactobacillus vini]